MVDDGIFCEITVSASNFLILPTMEILYTMKSQLGRMENIQRVHRELYDSVFL